ncbi:glycosyltransferase [Mucilaginibacter gilvus]|uniref:Glycosyl transferase n=1 Tax=Mucilaginibacter gilvus TaxID=2305909 RepID=A0A444MUL7_9SPHI|nr:glycosyltransferase [Mucilaginibacter gilvus]RWY57334.1 hypothetical protein EPL05_02025 [Mucilaginibacter gilvus]
MISKLKNSLAYRLPQVYKTLLGFKSIKKAASKPQADVTIITMTGKRLISMTRLSILSIARNWVALPRLIVITDGTISTETVKQKLAFWPGELTVYDWELTASYHLEKKRHNLVKYAGEHVLGKKMAAILHYAELSPVVWLDSDILFFSDFSALIPAANNSGFACGGSEDYSATYDDRILKHYDNDLYQLYMFNSGLMYVYGENLYERFAIEPLLAELRSYVYFFTEQTVFAHMASQSLGILWDLDVVKNFNGDNQSLTAMPADNVVARHYTTNVRHLFWRDAFFHLINA